MNDRPPDDGIPKFSERDMLRGVGSPHGGPNPPFEQADRDSMQNPAPEQSLSGEATFAARPRPQHADVSIGDERTLGGGGEAAGIDTVIDDIEVVDLEARYKIEGTLGQGGMGAVLLATDTRLDRKVAIKQILGEAAGNRMALQRFLTEAKAIAALNHPNIVQIYDYGRAKDGPFLIMEYVDGGSLLDRCRESALPIEEAIDLACQLCDGLAKAHDLGIVHRDIKPANVLLTKDGIPKLTDFGLAKAQAGDHGQTVTGAVLGTPDFMPPEQRRDAALVDHRSDLWSLAATVYQMVTGRSPKIIRFKDVPESIQEILGKALEDRKDARYQTARELREAFKTSMRKAAGGSPRADIATDRSPRGEVPDEGRCQSCGVLNEASRKFCRNAECGSSLRVACLNCETQIPSWDQICGECGGKQTASLAAKREALVAGRAEAESLFASFSFDAAIARASALAADASPDLPRFAAWGKEFVSSVTAERDRQRAIATYKQREASAHFADGDYAAAISAIESIPASLRDATITVLLEECHNCKREFDELIAMITDRISRKNLGGLLPMVERALSLRGDRKDLAKIREQLAERLKRQVAKARTAMNAGDAQAAVRALAGTTAEDLGEEASLLEHVTNAVATERRLMEVVRSFGTDEFISVENAREIILRGEECLAINPKNDQVHRIVEQSREILAGNAILSECEEIRKSEPTAVGAESSRESAGEREEQIAADFARATRKEERLASAPQIDKVKQQGSHAHSAETGQPFVEEFPYGDVNRLLVQEVVVMVMSASALLALSVSLTCLPPVSAKGRALAAMGALFSVLFMGRAAFLICRMVANHYRPASVLLDASRLTIPLCANDR